MRIGQFEARVVKPDGSSFFEVRHAATGEIYVVAEPGPFKIMIAMHDTHTNHRHYHHQEKIYKCLCKVDGKDIGVAKVFHHPGQFSYFEGIVKSGDTSSITLAPFQFARAVLDENREATSAVFNEGMLEVQFYECVRSNQRSTGKHYDDTEKPSKIPKLPEGKKFFLQPSLQTVGGALQQRSGFSSGYHHVVGDALATMRIRYETPTTLLLRNILSRENPQHAAILNSFPETRMASDNDGRSVGGRGNTARVKQEGGSSHGPRVKREREEEDYDEGYEVEEVDLTRLPNEGDEVIQAKMNNQVLQCDLTAEEEAPRWRKRAKEAVDLT